MEMSHPVVTRRRVNSPIPQQSVLIKVVSCRDLRTLQIRYSATLAPLSLSGLISHQDDYPVS